MLKTSEYNFIWPLENSDCGVIYNSFSGAVMEMRKQQFDVLKDNKEIELDLLEEEQKKTVNKLVQNGFLIEDYVDEKSILKFRSSKQKYNKETLTLTILPTYKCNLNCFYCYQDKNNAEYMTAEVQEAILQFVLKSIKGVKHIHICWFGGEPLLGWNTICDLSKKLMKIAEESDCTYSAMMVSNGYLFDDNKISKLKELNIDTIQITLDGPPSLHSLRKGIAGDPEENFNKIINIIKNLIHAHIQVNIRINLDKANIPNLEELLDLLSEADLKGANIYPARLEPYTKACSNIESGCLHSDEFSDLETRFYQSLLEKGLINDLKKALPTLKGNFCISNQINSFTIDPDGYVYKCWNTIGDKKKMIMDIMNRNQDENEKKRMKMQEIQSMIWDPFEIKECTECKYLPICMGGCPNQFKESNQGKPKCLTVKDNLREIIINHLNSLKINSILQ